MSLTHSRARVAALSRSRSNDDPELVAAKQTLRAEKLEQQIQRIVNEAPPLSSEQLERLSTLLTDRLAASGVQR